MRPLRHYPLLSAVHRAAFLYPTPTNLSYYWNFGSLAGLALLLQVLTGLALTFWYVGSVDLAFSSVEFLMREVNGGWLLRYLHANGASLFFVVVYLHVGRGLYFGSYMFPRERLWMSGVLLLLLMILTAFLGYVLPWGQMSYWAATVITSLLSVIPVVGEPLLQFVWGGISIDQPTLTRVYGLHYLLPFVLIALAGLHVVLLHGHGSNNASGMEKLDTIPFHPYFTYKDLVGVLVALLGYAYVVFRLPNALSHADNYVLADPGVTPTHIVPEWYFLPFYAILRSVPSKTVGVLLLLGAILTLFVLPFLTSPLQRSGNFRPLLRKGLAWFFMLWFVLGWSGGNPIETPYYEVCQAATLLYFGFFFVYLPLVNRVEQDLYFEAYGRRNKENVRAIRLAGQGWDVEPGEDFARYRLHLDMRGYRIITSENHDPECECRCYIRQRGWQDLFGKNMKLGAEPYYPPTYFDETYNPAGGYVFPGERDKFREDRPRRWGT